MSARIYQRPKNAMQSGRARTDEWVLEFEQSEARKADPLMGWTGSGDTQAQVQLTFPSKDEAKAYAEKYGIVARVHATPAKSLKLQAYAPAAIWRAGSRSDVCVRSPGQVRKEAAQVDCGGSAGSFFTHNSYAPWHDFCRASAYLVGHG